MNSSFSVVAIVNEPEHVVRRFVNWYKHLGASQIYLYFDNPDDPTSFLYDDDHVVEVIRCDDAFWKSLELTRDVRFTMRQNSVYLNCYHKINSDWVLFVDGDEYVHVEGPTINERLAKVDDSIRCVNIGTAELLPNVVAPPKYYFRTPIGREINPWVYGDDRRFFRKRKGLVGHPFGKSFVRTGRNVRHIRQHLPEFVDPLPEPLFWNQADQAYLLHFICDGYESWASKVKWRANASGFPSHIRWEIEAILETGDDVQLKDLYTRLHEPRYRIIKRLRKSNALHEFTLPLLAD